MNYDIHGVEGEVEHRLPEYLILDIEPAIRIVVDYIEKGFGTTYLDLNSLIDGILHAICTDTPREALETYLEYLESFLIDEDFAVNDTVEIIAKTEYLAEVILSEFRKMGLYNLRSIWGYHLAFWVKPTQFVLAFGLPFEMDVGRFKLRVIREK